MNTSAIRARAEATPSAQLPLMAHAIQFLARRWPWWKGQSSIMDAFSNVIGERSDFHTMTPLRSKLRMTVPLADLVGRKAVAFGENDADLFRFLKLALTNSALGSIYLDIGANLGIFLLRIAESTGVRCIGFEPQPNLEALLQENITANGLGDLVEVRGVALGTEPGFVRMAVSERDSGVARVANDEGNVEVPISTLLQEFDVETWKKVAIVKIDVEGFELEVFRGAAPLFQEHRPTLVFEVNVAELNRKGRKPKELADFLRSVGYMDFRALDKFVYPIRNGMYPVANVIAVGSNGKSLLDQFGVNPEFRPTSKTNWVVHHYEF